VSDIADPKSRRGQRLRTVFEVLSEHPDGFAARQVLAAVEQRLPLNDHEQGQYDSGSRRFEKLTRFGTVNAVKAGWLLKDKGTWSLTEDGLAALEQYTDPTEFYTAAEAGYAAWAKQRASTAAPIDELPEAVPEAPTAASTSVTFEEAEETAFDEIRQHLATINPYDLQHLVAGLLRGMGYHVSWVSPPGKDRGVDVLAFRDPLGALNPRIKVQVKREQSKTAAKDLRAFMSVLNPGDVGVFVTLGGFTSDAQSEARNSETRRITLIDLSDLVDLWVQHYSSIPTTERRLLPLRPVWFLDASGGSEQDSD
jgi:restriction system protein